MTLFLGQLGLETSCRAGDPSCVTAARWAGESYLGPPICVKDDHLQALEVMHARAHTLGIHAHLHEYLY